MFKTSDEKFEIKRSKIDGVGLCVKRDYRKEEFIAHIDGEKVLIKKFTPALTKIGWNWIGASKYTWIRTDESPFRFINHSCDPNVAIRGERTVYALKHIHRGEEITMDYSLTECQDEWQIAQCSCGNKNCRKKIRAIQYLDKSTFLQKRPFISKKFREIFINSQKQ